MKTPLLLIVGRTASGKDTLASALGQKGKSMVISHTTRPKRYPTENTHIFHTKESAGKYPLVERVAMTTINDYEYFVTKNDLDGKDIYIIDPIGVQSLIKATPDTPFSIVYLYQTESIREKRYNRRQATPNPTFETRNASETEQFTEFEQQFQKIATGEDIDAFGEQCQAVYMFTNESIPNIVRILLDKHFNEH